MKLNISPNFDSKNSARVIKGILALSILCCVLAGLRVYWTHKPSYIYMIWNLILAWVPLLVAFELKKYHHLNPKKYPILFASGFIWLIFFPNCPYIITDLIHLSPKHSVPLWFDATLLFTFALTGLIAGYISLYFIHEILDHFFNKTINWILIGSILTLSGFGIYLGRVLRWNSWSLFTHPQRLVKDIVYELGNPKALFMTATFSFVMIFSYLILHSIIHLKHQTIHDQDQQKS